MNSTHIGYITFNLDSFNFFRVVLLRFSCFPGFYLSIFCHGFPYIFIVRVTVLERRLWCQWKGFITEISRQCSNFNLAPYKWNHFV